MKLYFRTYFGLNKNFIKENLLCYNTCRDMSPFSKPAILPPHTHPLKLKNKDYLSDAGTGREGPGGPPNIWQIS